MELTPVIFLALVAGCWAGPIAETISTEYTCATTCTGPSKFSYKSGTTYVYQYDVETKTAVMGSFDHHSGLRMSAKVHIEVLNQCEFGMRLSNVVLSETNPNSPMEMKTLDSEFSRAMERNLLRFSFQDGRVEELCPAGGDAPWVLNVKRGVLSTFQNSMENLQRDQKVKETDVSGDCDTEYTVGEGDRYTTIVKKNKNLLGCRNRQGAQTAIQGVPYTSSSDIQSLPILHATHECEQEINTRTQTIKSAICRESYKFLPFSRESSGAVTNSTQKLTYVEERSGVSSQRPVDTRATLLFEHVNDVSSSDQSRKEVEGRLVDICLNTKSGIQPETPRLFASLVYSLRKLDATSINQLYQEIQKGSICSDNKERLSKFFLDAIPMVGTSSSLRMLTRLIVNKDVTGIEAEMWMTTMAFIQKPTMEMLTEIKPLLTIEDDNGKALLAVSSLVNRLCLFNDACDSDPAVNEIISTLESKIGSSCRVNDATMKTVLLSLRAIGNAGHAHRAIPTLTKCFTPTTNPMEIRISAVEAFRRISCNADWRAIEALFQNKEEDSELRIAAYRSLMECPSTNRLDIIKKTLQTEEVNQVGSYIWSHLTNLMETSDRHKQEIRSILEDDALQKEFDLDKRKFSRNYEKSFFIERMNTGAKFESDLIWSTKSFIPRSGMVNLTVDLFGNTFNLLQLGGRLEGLEYFIESYFGPDGYFGENQQAAESTAVRSIRPDKISKIDRRLKSNLDQLKGSLYMRVFGNELRYMSFNGQQLTGTGQDFDIFEMIKKISKGGDYTLSESFMFLDSSVIIPTSAGFPLNFTVNGTATVELKANGKFDIRKLSSDLEISGLIQPSGAIELSSTMSVDAFVTKSGLKMVSTLHTSSALQGKVQLSNGRVFVAELDMPQEKMNIISVKTAFFTVHRDVEKEQKMIVNNRQIKRLCSGADLSKIVGLEICGELEFPNATMEANAPYFPLTGPVNMGLTLYKSDAHTGYRFQAKSIHTGNVNLLHLSFDTPGSRVNRALTADFNLNKNDMTLDMSFLTPWKGADFKGAITNDASTKSLNGKLVWDNNMRYLVNSRVQIDRNGNQVTYTPSLEIRTPNRDTVSVNGVVKYSPWTLLDLDLAFSGITIRPSNVKATIERNSGMAGMKCSVSVGKEEYSLETRMQREQNKQNLIYNPILSIRTPKGELVALGGSVSYVKGKGCNINLVLDKAFEKQVSLKGKFLTNTNKRGSSLTANVDVKSSLLEMILKGKFDKKPEGSLSTDIDLTYFVKQYTRNNIKFVSKIINMSTKTLTKARATANLNVKKNPELNFKALVEMNHNYKHSEFDADINYGPDFKDQNRSIEVSAQLNHDIKGWASASADCSINFKHVGQGLNFLLKGSHKHDRRDLDSSVYLRRGKSTFESSLRFSDKTKDLMNIAGEFALSIPGTDIKLTNTLTQPEISTYTNDMNIDLGKTSKNRIITTVRKPDDKSMQISSDVNFSGMQPMKVRGEYNLNQGNQLVQLEMIKDQLKYIVTVTGQSSPQYKIVIDTQYPTRHVIATLDGSRTGETYNGSFDLKWDVDRDDSLSITLIGKGRFASIKGFEGSLTTRYLSRELILNVRHLADTKYISSIDFQWEPKKVLSLQGSLTQRTAAKKSQLVADIGFSSPFKGYRDMSLKVNHKSDPSQITSDIDFAWNPSNKISTTMSLKVPVSARNIDLNIFAKTPFDKFQQIKASLVHSVSNSSQTTAQLSWDKEFVQADISFISSGDANKRNLKGQLDVKTSSKSFKIISLSASHKDDGRAYDDSLRLNWNKDTYGLDSSMIHEGQGWSIQNNGKVNLILPSLNLETTWAHSNTPSTTSSSLTSTWGKRKIYINFNGKQAMTFPRGAASASLEIQTPFDPITDLSLTMTHEHNSGSIISNLAVMNQKSRVLYIDVNHQCGNGQIKSTFQFFSPRLGASQLNIDTQYQRYPVNLHWDLVIASKNMFSIDMSIYDFGDASLELKTPISGYEKVSLQTSVKTENQENVFGVLVSVGSSSTITAVTRYRFDSIKRFNVVIKTPYAILQSLQIDVRGQGYMSSFSADASVEIIPVLNRMSLSGRLNTVNGLSCKLRVDTPFRQLPYFQITANSEKPGEMRTSVLEVEYLPSKVLKLESVYNLSDLRKFQGTFTLTTPFVGFDYSNFEFIQDGDRNGKYNLAINVDTLSDMKADITLQTPIDGYEQTSVSLLHTGSLGDFVSRAELLYGRGNKYSAEAKINTNPSTNIELTLLTPLQDYRVSQLLFTSSDNMSDLKLHAEILFSEDKSALDFAFSSRQNIMSSLVIASPYFSPVKASFSHQGLITNFNTRVQAEYGRQSIFVQAKLNAVSGVTGSLILRTPFKRLENHQLTFSYDGTPTNFQSSAKYVLNAETISIDISFANVQASTGTITIKSPWFKPILTSFSLERTEKNIRVTGLVSYDKKKMQAEARLDVEDDVHASASLTTPFDGLEELTATFDLSGSLQNFRCRGELGRSDQKIEISANFDSTRDLSGSFSFLSPISGYENIGVSFKHVGGLDNFNCEANIIVNRDSIEGKSSFNLRPAYLDTSASIISTLSSIPRLQFRLKHSGYPRDMIGHVEAMINNDKHEADITFNMKNGITGIITVRCPFINDIDIALNHAGDLAKFRSHLDVALAGVKKVDMNVALATGQDITGDLSIDLPLQDFRTSRVSFKHVMSSTEMRSHFEIFVMNKETVGDMAVTISPNIEGSVSLKNPFTEDIASSFKFIGNSKIFESSAEILYGEVQQLHIGSSISISQKLTGKLSVQSVFFESVEVSFEHEGQLSTFQSGLQMSYGTNRLTGKISCTFNPNIEVDITITTPFKGYERINAASYYRGTISNSNSHAEISIGKNKHEIDITFTTNPRLRGWMSVKSPYFNDIEANIDHAGEITNFMTNAGLTYGTNTPVLLRSSFDTSAKIDFKFTLRLPFVPDINVAIEKNGDLYDLSSHGEISVGDKKIEADVSFNTKDKLAGNLSLRSTMFRPFQASFEHTGGLSSFKCHADASFGIEKTEMDLTFDSDESIEGSLTIGSTSFETIRVTFTHSGPINAFRSHAESSFGDTKVESDIQFSWNTIVEGRFSLQSPWFSPIKASFEHSGAVSDFKSHAEVTLGSRTTSGDVRLNLIGKISASVSVQSPLFDDVIATLEYNGDISNMRSEATLSSGKRRFSAMTVFAIRPNFNLEVVVATPVQGYERTSIAIRYDGYLTNFKCHAEIFIANKRSEGDLIFKVQPKLEGNIVVKTPFFKDTSIKFDAATSSASLEAHSTMLYGGERIFHLDANYQADNVIIANIEMTTPLQGFRQLGGNFNFDGNLRRFQTSFELRKETEKLISTRAMFESDNKLSGQLSFLTPVTSLLTGNFNHNGQLSDFKSDFDINYGEMRMYANVMFRAAPTEGSIEIKTPFMSDISGSFRFDGQPNNFKINVNGKALGETGSSDMSFTTDNGITGNIKVQSSIPFLDNIEGSFSHVMGYKNIESNAKIYYSPGKTYEINGRVSWRKILEGTFIIKSPIVDWEQTSISFRHQGSFPNIQTHAEMIQSLQKFEIDATLAFDGSSVGAISIKTPITGFENMGVSFRRVGDLSNLVAEAKVTYASQKTISGSYNHNIIGNKLQTRAIFTNPYTEDITLSYNQDGDFNNFASTLEAYMGSQNGLSTELLFKNSLQTIDFKSTATLILEGTSKSSRLALRHDGSFSNFKTTASANFMGKESKVEASLKSDSTIQGSISIQTPLENFRDIGLSFEHSWNLGKISTRGSIKYDVIKTIGWDFSHYGYNWHQLRTSFEVRTPFTGYEYNKVSYEHNGNKNGFRCNAQIDCARQSITALLQASNIPMNFGLDVKTSIPGYEEMSMKGKLESRSGMYSSEAKISLSRDSVIALAGSVDLTVTPMTGKLQLTTPLQGFESMEARISHSGEWRNFETAIYLNTPFASTISTSLNFKHVNTRNGFSSQANFNWGSPVSQMMGYELSLDQETSRLKVRLPSRTLALMGTKRTNTYTSHTEGSFLWDADFDPNKKIAFTADIKPQDDFLKADVTLMMPTIGKDFKLGSEMILNRGAVIFDGKTQLSFSTDSRKTLSVFTRLVDLSSGSFSKNYSFSLGISHPYSSVDISLKSHAGSSSDRVSAGFDLSYLTARGETKSIGFNGELDSVRKQMTFKADTPLQNIQISGNVRTEAPYTVILRNAFDMTTELSLDPVGRAINVHMNYDIDNPRDALHISARYINSSALAAEMYHVTSSGGRITDGMVSLRLNTSTLLHSRIHWRPSIIRDLRSFINMKSEKYMVNFQNTLTELRENVHDEIYLKSRRISQVFDEDFAAFRQDLEALQAMYENNDYHLKDIVDSIIVKYQELNQLSVDYLVSSKEWTAYHTERMILAMKESINVIMDEMPSLYFHLLDKVSPQYINRMKLTGLANDPQIVSYLQKLNSFHIKQQVSDMARQYSSVIYNTHDLVNNHLTNLLGRDNVDLLQSTLQHGKNAYKYWEIEENVKLVLRKIYLTIRRAVEEELTFIQHFVNMSNSGITVYDPVNGEIQADIYLPIPLQSLDVLPVLNIRKYSNRINSYLPGSFDTSFYIPDSDYKNWLPPFKGQATLEGSQITTFDGKTYTLSSSCTFILARDFKNGNFSIILKNDNEKEIIIIFQGKTIEMLKGGKILVDAEPKDMPYRYSNVIISTDGSMVTLDAKNNFLVNYNTLLDRYTFTMSGWYYGKIAGLLGSYDNEPSNDFVTSFGKVIDDERRFSSTWEVGSGSCR
ncbi:hypothetical protein ACJMK2_039441 [Sinanodonta woodiana]|uniref:Apolipophorin n=1 Tax=Sinanodonta woodiana TaxID=1069815 RepID=A0ABD3WC07_SINWO